MRKQPSPLSAPTATRKPAAQTPRLRSRLRGRRRLCASSQLPGTSLLMPQHSLSACVKSSQSQNVRRRSSAASSRPSGPHMQSARKRRELGKGRLPRIVRGWGRSFSVSLRRCRALRTTNAKRLSWLSFQRFERPRYLKRTALKIHLRPKCAAG
ncbi:hypothetical protein B0H15DRAFT_869705 [Mycena belliarum]|uniref:Uncharacterized protein n=1 Tax=Mycena belliarum TaxID=1033014 RepID=A0AAD6TMD9_9AGAR|nr:hypothetical protein B0H15DRAFT_869705 [Mycena belliae]